MRAIILDLDNTLFEHAAALRRLGLAEFALREEQASRVVAASIEFSHRRFLEILAEELGTDIDDAWERLQAGFARHIEPDVPIGQLVEELRETDPDVVLGVLTNGGTRMQRSKVSALRLEELIAPHRIVISEEVGHWKPAREVFELACKRCGVDPSDALYVGDRPDDDIAGARNAGLASCWVARGNAFPDTPQPDFIVDTVAELPELWERSRT